MYTRLVIDRFVGYQSLIAPTAAPPQAASELLNAVVNHVGWLETREGRKCVVATTGFEKTTSITANIPVVYGNYNLWGYHSILGQRAIGIAEVRYHGLNRALLREGVGTAYFQRFYGPLRRVGGAIEVGVAERMVLVPQRIEPFVNWLLWAVVPYDGIEFEPEELDIIDPLGFLEWCNDQSYVDELLGEARGVYVVNFAPVVNELVLDGIAQGSHVAQFVAYELPDGSYRLLYAPRRGLLRGYGELISALGVGNSVVVADIYNGNYYLSTEKRIISRTTGQGQQIFEERDVLVAKGLTGGEFVAPSACVVPIFEGEEIRVGDRYFVLPKPEEAPLGLIRFRFEEREAKFTEPKPEPYLASPHLERAALSQEPPGVTLLKFWETVGAQHKLNTSVPVIWVDRRRTYRFTNAPGQQFVDVTQIPRVGEAADLYRWEDVTVKYYPVMRPEATLAEEEIEAERSLGGVRVRVRKKTVQQPTPQIQIGNATGAGSNYTQPDYGVGRSRAGVPPLHYVRPIDLVYGDKAITRKRTGPRRTDFRVPEDDTAYLPMVMWNYRFMWEYEDGSFSAVSHPVPCYDLLWSAADDTVITELSLLNEPTTATVSGQFIGWRYARPTAAPGIFDPTGYQSRPFSLFRAPWDALRSLLRYPIYGDVIPGTHEVNVDITAWTGAYGQGTENPFYNSPPVYWQIREGRLSIPRHGTNTTIVRNRILDYINNVFLPLKRRLYPSGHRFAQATTLDLSDFYNPAQARQKLESLVCMTAYVEGDGIVFPEAIVADIGTHAGEIKGGPVFNPQDLVVEIKHKDVAKLVVPVFPRIDYPGWHKTLCTSEGYLRLAYQIGGPYWVSPAQDDAGPWQGRWYYRSIFTQVPSQNLDPGGGIANDWNWVKFYDPNRTKGILGKVPSALLVLPGTYSSLAIHFDGWHDYQNADFPEKHASDGIWLNIITAYDLRLPGTKYEELPATFYPTQCVVVNQQTERLDYTADIPVEVRERLLVNGFIELPLVRPGNTVGITPEWAVAADGSADITVSGHRLCPDDAALGEVWKYPQNRSGVEYDTYLKRIPITVQQWIPVSELIDGRAEIQSGAPDQKRKVRDAVGPNAYAFAITARTINGITRYGYRSNADYYQHFPDATINNIEVIAYLPATRLLLHEQLTMALPGAILFEAPRQYIYIPHELIPEKAARLWIFRTRAVLDNDYDPDEYGLVARIEVKRRIQTAPRAEESPADIVTEDILWKDTVRDDELDFSVRYSDYLFRRSPIRSLTVEEHQGITWYGHLITDEYTGNLGSPSWYLGQEQQPALPLPQRSPVWLWSTNENGELVPAYNFLREIELGIVTPRDLPPYFRESAAAYTDIAPILPNTAALIPYPQLPRGGFPVWAHPIPHHLGILNAGITQSGVLLRRRFPRDPNDPNSPIVTRADVFSLLGPCHAFFLPRWRSSAWNIQAGKWYLYELRFVNAQDSRWGWTAGIWLVRYDSADYVFAITGIPYHSPLKTGYRVEVLRYKADVTASAPDTLRVRVDANATALCWTVAGGSWIDGVGNAPQPIFAANPFPTEFEVQVSIIDGGYRNVERIVNFNLSSGNLPVSPLTSREPTYYPDGIAWSVPGVPWNIPERNIVTVGEAVGGGITALKQWNGQLIVFKEHAIYRLMTLGDDPTEPITQVEVVTDTEGCIAPKSVALLPGGIAFLGNSGLWYFTGAGLQRLDSAFERELQWRIMQSWSDPHRHSPALATGVYYKNRNVYLLSFPYSEYDDPYWVRRQPVDRAWDPSTGEIFAPMNMGEWNNLAGEVFVVSLDPPWASKFQVNLPGDDEYEPFDIGRRAHDRRHVLLTSTGRAITGITFLAIPDHIWAYETGRSREADRANGLIRPPRSVDMFTLWARGTDEDQYGSGITVVSSPSSVLLSTAVGVSPIRFLYRSQWITGDFSSKRFRRASVWCEPLALGRGMLYEVFHPVTNSPFGRSARLGVYALNYSRGVGSRAQDVWRVYPPLPAVYFVFPADTTPGLPPVQLPLGWQNLGPNWYRTRDELRRRIHTAGIFDLVPGWRWRLPDAPDGYLVWKGTESGIAFVVEVETWGYTALKGLELWFAPRKVEVS